MHYNVFTYISADGHLGCFYFLAVMNGAAVNIHVQVFCGHVFLIFLGEVAGAQLPFTEIMNNS